MTRLRGPIAVTAAVAFFLLSACARGDAEDPGAPAAEQAGAPAAADDDAVVIRVRHEGGFVPADRLVGRMPRISLYGDGRLITEGPQIAIYPGPALPSLQVRQLDRARVDKLIAQAGTAGVGSGADLGRPGVADAPTTVIEAATAGGPKSVSVEALNEAMPDDPQLTEAHRQARAKLAAFVTELTELGAAAAQPYQAKTLAALASPYVQPADDLPEQPAAITWPGPALPGESMSESIKMGCVTVTGAELDKILAAGAKANQNTPWTSGGKQYALTFRPLLPDETGCADLKAAR